jgi:hypothetical protein
MRSWREVGYLPVCLWKAPLLCNYHQFRVERITVASPSPSEQSADSTMDRTPFYLDKLFDAAADRSSRGSVPAAVRLLVRVHRNPSSRHYEYMIGNSAWLRLETAAMRLAALVDQGEQPAPAGARKHGGFIARPTA